MATHSLWSGSIAFGLVQIPVALHAAEEPNELKFRQIDAKDLAPVGYERVNKRTGKVVPWEQIVRGYEYEPDRFVVITDEEIAAANVEATHTIDLLAFVELAELDPIYFERPYFVVPTKAGVRAYVLLHDTMKRSGLIGIGNIVIRTRQTLAALLPRGDQLVLITLRYASEVRPVEALPVGASKAPVTAQEKKMADLLVESMRQPFDPDAYSDTFKDDVMALIAKKIEAGDGRALEPEAPRRAEPTGKVVDLLALLEKSLGKRPAPKKASAKTRSRA